MDKSLLLKPVPKPVPRGCIIEKKYPFPIFRESSAANVATDDSKQDWRCFIGHLQADCVLVSDEDNMNMIFSMGFYGKGTLSKRAPGFHSSEKNVSQDMDHCSSEDEGVPESKRKSVHHEGVPESKKRKEHHEESFLNVKVVPKTSPRRNLAVEPTVSFLGNEKESLQLTFQEAFFLSYGLGCLVVMDNDKPLDLIKLWQKFCNLSPNKDFPVKYTAYHHFRSKGWVVRSGLNYGADYVLYKDGPSFYHSTYSVIVKAIEEKDLSEIESSGRLPMTWSFLSAMNRVNTHVAKGVMFAFVVKPVLMSDHILTTPLCVSRFKVQELLVKRWAPNTAREK